MRESLTLLAGAAGSKVDKSLLFPFFDDFREKESLDPLAPTF